MNNYDPNHNAHTKDCKFDKEGNTGNPYNHHQIRDLKHRLCHSPEQPAPPKPTYSIKQKFTSMAIGAMFDKYLALKLLILLVLSFIGAFSLLYLIFKDVL